MEAIILSKEQYDDMVMRIEEIKKTIIQNSKEPKEIFVDNQEFLKLMNISKRTGQTWRDEGIISFSQIGSKIYYKMDDITKMLNKNYKPAYKK
jgi:hypothetical protein